MFLIEADAVYRRRDLGVPSGRPISPRAAWAIIYLADGRRPAVQSPTDLRRARERLAALPTQPPDYLRTRADIRLMRAHPGVLERLRSDPRLVLSGADAARVHDADIHLEPTLDAYAQPGDVPALAHEFALSDARRPNANVVLRIPTIGIEIPADSSGHIVARALLALDLIDAGDERSIRAGRQFLASPSPR